MNIRTCYGCPLRNVDGKRCEILEAKVKAIRGMGFTSVAFNCPTKKALFKPGQCVQFLGSTDVGVNDSHFADVEFLGWVMGWKGNKVRIACEQTNAPIVHILPEKIQTPDPEIFGEEDIFDRRPCIHCGMPEGLKVQIKPKHGEGELHKWECRYSEYEPSMTPNQIVLPCEYAPPALIEIVGERAS